MGNGSVSELGASLGQLKTGEAIGKRQRGSVGKSESPIIAQKLGPEEGRMINDIVAVGVEAKITESMSRQTTEKIGKSRLLCSGSVREYRQSKSNASSYAKRICPKAQAASVGCAKGDHKSPPRRVKKEKQGPPAQLRKKNRKRYGLSSRKTVI